MTGRYISAGYVALRRTSSRVRIAELDLHSLAGPVAFPLPALQKANRASIAFGSAGGDEMMPGAGVRGLLNPPPLRGVLLLEGSGFDGLAELELYGAIVFAAGLASIVYPLLLQPLLERWDDASLGDR